MTSAQEFGLIAFYSMWRSQSSLHREDTLIRTGDMTVFRLPVARESRQGPAVGRRAEDGPSIPRSRAWEVLDVSSTLEIGSIGLYSTWPSQ